MPALKLAHQLFLDYNLGDAALQYRGQGIYPTCFAPAKGFFNIALGLLDILFNLRRQLLRAGKLHLGAQALHKLDGELPAIEVSGKIEDMYFYSAFALAEGRLDPDIGHRLINLIADMSQRSIDAVLGKRLLGVHLYIRRGKAQRCGLVPPHLPQDR